MSGTLSKSGSSGSRTDYTKDGHVDYSKVPAGSASRVDTAYAPYSSVRSQPASNGEKLYRADYGKMSGGKLDNQSVMPFNGNAEINDRLVKQYAEMDRLADLVLYELNILEKRWDLLLSKYKTAAPADRERIAADLDLLSADQLKLYRAHVKIYKEGKNDWEATKKDVDATLLAVRGVR